MHSLRWFSIEETPRLESQVTEPRDSSPAFSEAARILRSWESQTELVEDREGVPLTFPFGSIVLVPEVEAHSFASSVENEDSLLAYDSDEIDGMSVETYRFCSMLNKSEYDEV